MLETIINSLKRTVAIAGLSFGLHGCGDTNVIINNYYGSDGGAPNDVSVLTDGNNQEVPDAGTILEECTPENGVNCIECNLPYPSNSQFRIRNISFTYLDSEGLSGNNTSYLHMQNGQNGSIQALVAQEGVPIRVGYSSDFLKYGFKNVSSPNSDDFDVTLRYPCDLIELACGKVIKFDDNFMLGGHSLTYKGSDRVTKTSPKIKFKDENSAETLEYSIKLAALFDLEVEGVTHYFISASVSDHHQNNYIIQLVHPCGE